MSLANRASLLHFDDNAVYRPEPRLMHESTARGACGYNVGGAAMKTGVRNLVVIGGGIH